MHSDQAAKAIRTTIKSLVSDQYEIGIRSEETNKMMLRCWDVETLLAEKTIRFLKARNANREHIYIRPVSPNQYTLLDDIDKPTITQMENFGFAPCLVIETSPNNFQAWLNHGQQLDNDLSTFVAQQLASKFNADLSSADFRHFGRLPGFTNTKKKHHTGIYYPFVKVTSSTNVAYREAGEFLRRSRTTFSELNKTKAQKPGRFSNNEFEGLTKTIDDFHSNAKYEGDMHRADIGFAVYALSHGMPESDLFDCLINARDLDKKGSAKCQWQYVERTIAKAGQ